MTISNLKLSLFLKILALFGLTQFLGIYLATALMPKAKDIGLTRISDFSTSDYVIFFGAAILFILSFKFRRFGVSFYKVFLTLLIFSMSQLTIGVFTGPLAAFTAAVVITVIFWTLNTVFFQDLVMVLTLAGAGAVVGLSITPTTAVIMLIVLSFYDIVAVYKTRHMIKLAQAMIESRAIFGFVVPQSLTGFGKKLSSVAPGGEFMILGSGDVAMPLILASSLVAASFRQSLVVASFSLLGLFLMHLLFNLQKVKKPMAALPPIAALAIIGYLIASI